MQSGRLGPAYTDVEIEAALNAAGVAWTRLDTEALYPLVAEKLDARTSIELLSHSFPETVHSE